MMGDQLVIPYGGHGMGMGYALVGIVLLILAVVGVIVYWLLALRGSDRGGFWDWVKNPDYKTAAAAYFAERDSIEVPKDISDTAIKQMVKRLYVRENDDFNRHRLKLVGAKALPFLIEALDDPKTARSKFGKGGHAMDPDSPFQCICDLLEPIGTAEAVGPLARYMKHEDYHFRMYAAMALGNIGTVESISPMLAALTDDNDSVRTFAMYGIQRGIDSKKCTSEFLDAVFPALTTLLDRRDGAVGVSPPYLMLRIDKERAVAILLSPEHFTIENREVHRIIGALNGAGYKIPHDKLMPFLKAAEPLQNKYPHDYAYAAALRAYSRNPDASAEKVLRAAMESPNDEVQEAAADSLGRLLGVTDPHGVVSAVLDEGGFDALSAPQQHYWAVLVFNGEVCNGGHAQYFVNSSGDHWRAALQGLSAIEANERASILEKAIDLFGSDGPPEDNDARHRQLANFSKDQDKVLADLDSKYYACKENIDVLLAHYALKHKDDFASKTGTR